VVAMLPQLTTVDLLSIVNCISMNTVKTVLNCRNSIFKFGVCGVNSQSVSHVTYSKKHVPFENPGRATDAR
jgi:hypothetical protein